EVRISTASFATMWRRMCGERPISEDSGFVFGLVRDVMSNRPIADALVSVVWLDSAMRLGPGGRTETGKQQEAFEAARRIRKDAPMRPVNFELPAQKQSGEAEAFNVA